MTTTETADRTAADVAWDLEPLVDGRGVAGVDAQLDAADALAAELETLPGPRRRARRRRPGRGDARDRRARRADRPGRVRTPGCGSRSTRADPELGALMQRVEERATAISTRVLFFELEWAALSDERVDELLADDRLDVRAATTCARPAGTARTCSPSPRRRSSRRRTSPARARGPGSSTSSRPMITIELDGETVGLEQGLSLLASPDRSVRAAAAAAVTEGLAPGLRTPRVRVQHAARGQGDRRPAPRVPGWIASRNLANEASDESVPGAGRRGAGAQRHPAALVLAQGPAARARSARGLRPHGVGRDR